MWEFRKGKKQTKQNTKNTTKPGGNFKRLCERQNELGLEEWVGSRKPNSAGLIRSLQAMVLRINVGFKNRVQWEVRGSNDKDSPWEHNPWEAPQAPAMAYVRQTALRCWSWSPIFKYWLCNLLAVWPQEVTKSLYTSVSSSIKCVYKIGMIGQPSGSVG